MESNLFLFGGPLVISSYPDPELSSSEGVCQYHGEGHNIRMQIIGTYNELALHLVEQHYDIWLQVQEFHGMSKYQNIKLKN